MLNNIRNYIKQEEFQILIKDNSINIINYSSLGNISEKEIIIFNNNNNKVIVKGSNLSINKLLSSEILILGKFNNIIFEGKDE